uniref:Transmembrane protein 250 n=1 Tax=Rousettus aegyptiacus TaxID=9407 RepID=A0A7J8IV20_ROUAE|nr:transmembrane protein 250 [Rousettus aegyptiacus]
MTPMLTAAWTPPPPRASAAAQAPMPVMPIPRRVRSFHGPHTTCLHAACGPARASRLARTKYNNFDVYVRARWLYGFIRFLLYFSCSLFTAALWGALAALFCLQYLGVRVLLRFQRKLSVLLLLLGRRRVDFRLLNELLVYGIHVTMLLVGGLGWCFMVFVDIQLWRTIVTLRSVGRLLWKVPTAGEELPAWTPLLSAAENLLH